MGCQFSSEAEDVSESPAQSKQYSWDTREAINPDDFTIKGLRNGSATRENGSVEGNQLLIEDCQGSDIYVLDNSAVVTIDDCVDCTVFIGPVAGSIFIRDSKNCRFIIACQQFRTRDCADLEVLLSCNTLPIIESTEKIRFGCFRGSYFTLSGQFSSAGISPYNNYWYKIHDFTKSPDGDNFSFFQEVPTWVSEFFDRRPEAIKNIEIDVDPAIAVVPVTSGPERRSEPTCLVVAFTTRHAKKVLQTMIRGSSVKADTSLVVVRSAELEIPPEDAAQVFAGDNVEKFTKAAAGKSVVGFELCGSNVMSLVHAATSSLGDAPLFASESETNLKAFFAQTELKLKI